MHLPSAVNTDIIPYSADICFHIYYDFLSVYIVSRFSSLDLSAQLQRLSRSKKSHAQV